MRTDKARRCALSGKYFVIKEITQLHNSMNLKKSKFNYSIIDQEGNLIIYNFLRGIPSLTKVAKKDIDKFSQLVLKNTGISNASSNGYTKAISSLIESGLLIDEKTDENVLLDAKCYNAIYDNKLQLIILPTGQCNFKCVYCLESEQSFARNAMNLDSQNAILQFLQKQISEYNGLQVAWFGGEPMLEPETIKYLSENFIRICKSRFIPYSAHITTNGFNLNADMFDMLYKLKVYTYMITVDGFKNQHDKQRITHSGKGTYDRILNNLLRIKNSKQYKFARIIIRVNITKNNIDSIDDFINYMHTSFSDDHRFEFLFVPAEDFSKIILAYEPVWAIGTGKTATPAQAQEIHAFIRSAVEAKYGKEIAENCSILYGGSCKPSNAKELFANPDVDGGLIGGAALKVADFKGIIDAFN